MKITKKVLSVLLIMIMVVSLSIPVLADGGNVTYVGGAEKFIFSTDGQGSPTDIFGNFKGIMPGDSLTEKILLSHKADQNVKVNLYLRSLGAQDNTADFLSQLKLTVKQDGKGTLFEAPANETAQLSDWVFLGTLYYGGNTTLDLILDVPITLSDEYQDAIGYLDWEFKAEELPVSTNAKTGDDSNPLLWTSLLVIFAAAGGTALVLKKRKKVQ